MDPRLIETLGIVRQLPQQRQRDATSIIATVLGMSEREFKAHHTSLKELFEPADGIDDIDWGPPPGMMSLRFKPCSPIEPGVALSDELMHAIAGLDAAMPERQDAVRLILENMIENDSMKLDLTAEEEAEIKRLLDEAKREF